MFMLGDKAPFIFVVFVFLFLMLSCVIIFVFFFFLFCFVLFFILHLNLCGQTIAAVDSVIGDLVKLLSKTAMEANNQSSALMANAKHAASDVNGTFDEHVAQLTKIHVDMATSVTSALAGISQMMQTLQRQVLQKKKFFFLQPHKPEQCLTIKETILLCHLKEKNFFRGERRKLNSLWQ